MDITALGVIQKILIWALPVLFAIVFHEVAHGWVALKFGDKTALMLGRLSFNPLRHIDILGTIIVPIILLVFGGFIFGWAKAVPVNAGNLRKPRLHMAIVALAGPVANLIMAVIWALVMKLAIVMTNDVTTWSAPLYFMGQAGVFINLMLFILNLIPLPPLDGGRVVSNILPRSMSRYYDKVEPYGFFILIILLFTGILAGVLIPLLGLSSSVIFHLLGLPG